METIAHEIREHRQSRRVNAEPEPKQTDGRRFAASSICANCVHKDVCMHLARAGSPVQFCEEWEMRQMPREITPETEDAAPQPASSFKGLCQTCEERETCGLSHTSEGIWRCEHYR